jgi:hypothetical protein
MPFLDSSSRDNARPRPATFIFPLGGGLLFKLLDDALVGAVATTVVVVFALVSDCDAGRRSTGGCWAGDGEATVGLLNIGEFGFNGLTGFVIAAVTTCVMFGIAVQVFDVVTQGPGTGLP